MSRRFKLLMWRLACWLAIRSGHRDPRRAIYIGPDRTRIVWQDDPVEGMILGAETGLCFSDDGTVSTIFGPAGEGRG